MFSSATIVTLIVIAVSGNTFARSTALTCAVCPPTIFFEGQTRFLTLAKEEESNTLMCDDDRPMIRGLNPFCLYANLGSLIFTNTGGACPGTPTLETQNHPINSACTAEPIPTFPPGTPVR
ncbi:hypothetical protein QCA50_011497 [Cerrena zonata]|uniref:Secreted protein n=1 Tax=Cerrena zonata TaxID=2478898 RepID=A0AAW0FH05_9APHY